MQFSTGLAICTLYLDNSRLTVALSLYLYLQQNITNIISITLSKSQTIHISFKPSLQKYSTCLQPISHITNQQSKHNSYFIVQSNDINKFTAQRFKHCWPISQQLYIFPIMVHLDTNNSTCWPQQSSIMALCHLAPNRADLVCHATQTLATQRLGVTINQFISHMTQNFGIISQFRLLLAMSHVYTCAGIPTCTIYIALS